MHLARLISRITGIRREHEALVESPKLVRHTAKVPSDPFGASLRGRLLTISVHTVLFVHLKGAVMAPKSKTPGSAPEPEVVR
jgi:hypothetical protein